MEYKGMKEDERFISVTPSKRQIAYQNMEYFCFIHFTVNTFTGSEWGLGDEPESIFNPEELDARQWAKTATEGGMKGGTGRGAAECRKARGNGQNAAACRNASAAGRQRGDPA